MKQLNSVTIGSEGIIYSYKSSIGTEYSWRSFESLTEIEQPKISYADHSFVLDVLKRMSGRTLTLIEASISDKEQRKALKDIVKGFFSEEMNHIHSLMFSQEYNNELCEMGGKISPTPNIIDVEEIIRA